MAQQLLRMNEQVGLLAMLDTEAPGYPKVAPFIVRLGMHVKIFWHLSARDRVRYSIQRLRRLGDRAQRLIGRGGATNQLGPGSLAEAIQRTSDAMATALRKYKLANYPGQITLLHAQDKPDWLGTSFDDPQMGWGTFAKGGVEVLMIPGSHLEIVKYPAITTLARRLRACLLARQDAQRVHGAIEEQVAL
jgi:thioesterase domain-containing protein